MFESLPAMILLRFGFGDEVKSCGMDLNVLEGNVRGFVDVRRDCLLL